MKNTIIWVAGMLIFCLLVLLIPLNIMGRSMDKDKNIVKSISDDGSKQQMEFVVGKENHYTKLLLLAGILESDKEVVPEEQISSETKKMALSIVQFELSNLYELGYYGVEPGNLEKNYEISFEKVHYSDRVFDKYTCDVWKLVLENKMEKHTIIFDAEDFTFYELEMDLNEAIDVNQAYADHSGKIAKKEIAAYISPLTVENQRLVFTTNDQTKSKMSVNPTEKDVEEVGGDKYQIKELDGTVYYARLEKQARYLKFKLLPQL